MAKIEILQSGRMLLKVDKSIYECEAVLRAAYSFTDTCFVEIESVEGDKYAVYFSHKNSNVNLEVVIKEFCNELIDQQIRLDLERKHGKIREIIVKQAFAPLRDLREALEDS